MSRGRGSRSRSGNGVSENAAGDGIAVVCGDPGASRLSPQGKLPGRSLGCHPCPCPPARQALAQPLLVGPSARKSSSGSFDWWNLSYCLLSSYYQARLRSAGLFRFYSTEGGRIPKVETLRVGDTLSGHGYSLPSTGVCSGNTALEISRARCGSSLFSACFLMKRHLKL